MSAGFFAGPFFGGGYFDEAGPTHFFNGPFFNGEFFNAAVVPEEETPGGGGYYMHQLNRPLRQRGVEDEEAILIAMM
jgi:hypothetical protein